MNIDQRENAFERKFTASSDPWGTLTNRDEQRKLHIILRSLPNGQSGAVLEIGCGAGGHSAALAKASRKFHAVDFSHAAVKLTQQRLAGIRGATVFQHAVPSRFPPERYSAIVISEFLYYLTAIEMRSLALQLNHLLSPRGVIILCHHHTQFSDARQYQRKLHWNFTMQLPFAVRSSRIARTHKWEITRVTRRA